MEDDVLWGADGQALPVQYAAHPMYRDGRIVGAVVSFFDVAAEAARGRALAEAERLVRVRSEFLANTSHEIRTPSARCSDWLGSGGARAPRAPPASTSDGRMR